MRRLVPALLPLVTLAACVVAPVLDTDRLVDLGHPYDADTVSWPGGPAFEHSAESGEDAEGRWYATGRMSLSEHSGTHLDAPVHFAREGRAVDELPFSNLIGPVRVIDVREACAQDRDYAVRVEDITAHEAAEGRIQPGSAVLVLTGWSVHWHDRLRYLGGEEVESLHFPGLDLEAARLLADRRVGLVGIDTASIDPGTSRIFGAHRVLAEAQVPCLENLRGLEVLPARGASLIALPMLVAGGSGAPARVIALLP
ncbi:MAG TPA: cyclase family protein [Planctomycetota bacterium]|nr:cyclase family protein [Planctomycetota bacterium]